MFYNKSSNKDLTDYGSTNITIVESTKNPDNECHVEDIARNIKVRVFEVVTFNNIFKIKSFGIL